MEIKRGTESREYLREENTWYWKLSAKALRQVHTCSQGIAGKQWEEGGGADLAGPEEGCILLSLMDQECLVPAAQSRR